MVYSVGVGVLDDPAAFRRRKPPRRPVGRPPYNPLSRLCVGRGALTPPQVHVAVRFPFSHRPQHQLQPVLSIRISGSEESEKDRFIKVLYSTLQELSRKGIPQELMEAELSSEEFKMREADFNVYPKGLIYGLSIMETWL